MLSLIKTAFIITVASILSAIVGGIALSLLTVFISSRVVGVHDLSYSLVMFSSTLTIAALICGLAGAIYASPLRPQVFGSRIKTTAAVLVTCVIIASNTWSSLRSPQFYLRAMRYTDNHDPKTRSIYVKKLIAIGPRAIEPVIGAIRRNGTRSRGTWQLNVAVKGLGENARQQLLQAIDDEKDDWSQMHLIYSLHEAFGDFSRVHLFLKSLGTNKSSFYASALERQLVEKYQEQVPSVFTDYNSGKFTPEFVKWYQSKSTPKGPLPSWKSEPAK